jgi:hypothetical protein
LRWRLTRNQSWRGHKVNAVLGVLVVGFAGLIGIGGGVGGVLAGNLALASASPRMMLGLWDTLVVAFLFFWIMGVVIDLQRSELIDVSRLLHLPIALKDVFLINYVASHLTLLIVLLVPGMVGLGLGLSWSRGWAMMWLLPLVLSFLFMVTAWTYCLRGWLVTLMVNKRRRRAILVGIGAVIMVLSQAPNLFFTFVRNHDRAQTAKRERTPATPLRRFFGGGRTAEAQGAWLLAHRCLPPLWLGNGAYELARGRVWPAIAGSAGAFALGAIGLRRAYQATWRFYQGSEPGKPAASLVKHQGRSRHGPHLLERRLPGVPAEAGALALACLRSLSRAPEVKMMLLSNLLVPLALGVMFLGRRATNMTEVLLPFVATGAVAVTLFGMVQLMFNQFGFDRDGFRALVLLPAPRWQVFLGKNLAFMPYALTPGFAMLLLFKAIVAVPWLVILASGLQLVMAFCLCAMVGNLVSIAFPYRIAPGSMKPTKIPPVTMLMIFLSHLLFPAAMAPMLLPPALDTVAAAAGFLPAGAVNLSLSLGLLVVVLIVYWFSLPATGARLQARERRILEVVTHEVE